MKSFSAVCLWCFLICSCTWSYRDLNETKDHYLKNKDLYLQLVESYRRDGESGVKAIIDREFPPGTDFICWEKRTILEISPVDFYYVLVWVENPEDLKESAAMKDEGSVKVKFNEEWYLVQIGFM